MPGPSAAIRCHPRRDRRAEPAGSARGSAGLGLGLGMRRLPERAALRQRLARFGRPEGGGLGEGTERLPRSVPPPAGPGTDGALLGLGGPECPAGAQQHQPAGISSLMLQGRAARRIGGLEQLS